MESAKTHEFRLKTIVELSDEQLDKLETHLRKYEAFDIGSPKRTILQSAPLDFYNTGAREVYIMDFKTEIPCSPAQLVQELVQKVGIAERDIRVRNKLEPREEMEADIIDPPTEADSKALLTDSEYSEADNPNADDYHGEAHKTKFVKELEKSRRELYSEYKG